MKLRKQKALGGTKKKHFEDERAIAILGVNPMVSRFRVSTSIFPSWSSRFDCIVTKRDPSATRSRLILCELARITVLGGKGPRAQAKGQVPSPLSFLKFLDNAHTGEA